MGGAAKKVKRFARGVTRGIGEVFEEVIEKPTKKIGKEGFDIIAGTTDEERRAILYDKYAPEPEVTPEVTPEVVPDETLLASTSRRRTKGKRSGAGGTLMEGFGVAYAKPSSKSPTGSST